MAKSKTLVASKTGKLGIGMILLSLLLLVLQAFGDFDWTAIVEPQYAPVVMAFIGISVTWLRGITSTPIKGIIKR